MVEAGAAPVGEDYLRPGRYVDSDHPAIVLVMGLGMQMIMWPDALCEMLVAKGFRVVRFDNRDVGLSTHFDHLGMPRIGLETLKYLLRVPVKAPFTRNRSEMA